MNDFFAFPTVNSWEEDVFQLTTQGILAVVLLIVALIALALILQPKEKKSRRYSTKQLVFSAVAMALATVTSIIKLFEMPLGGSVTLFSMLFIVLIGYWYGPKAGLMTGFAYGLLQFVMEPVFYSIPQMIVDYPLAFGALGLSGFFFWQEIWFADRVYCRSDWQICICIFIWTFVFCFLCRRFRHECANIFTCI